MSEMSIAPTTPRNTGEGRGADDMDDDDGDDDMSFIDFSRWL